MHFGLKYDKTSYAHCEVVLVTKAGKAPQQHCMPCGEYDSLSATSNYDTWTGLAKQGGRISRVLSM
jgi:hypothetical protein